MGFCCPKRAREPLIASMLRWSCRLVFAGSKVSSSTFMRSIFISSSRQPAQRGFGAAPRWRCRRILPARENHGRGLGESASRKSPSVHLDEEAGLDVAVSSVACRGQSLPRAARCCWVSWTWEHFADQSTETRKETTNRPRPAEGQGEGGDEDDEELGHHPNSDAWRISCSTRSRLREACW